MFSLFVRGQAIVSFFLLLKVLIVQVLKHILRPLRKLTKSTEHVPSQALLGTELGAQIQQIHDIRMSIAQIKLVFLIELVLKLIPEGPVIVELLDGVFDTVCGNHHCRLNEKC